MDVPGFVVDRDRKEHSRAVGVRLRLNHAWKFLRQGRRKSDGRFRDLNERNKVRSSFERDAFSQIEGSKFSPVDQIPLESASGTVSGGDSPRKQPPGIEPLDGGPGDP